MWCRCLDLGMMHLSTFVRAVRANGLIVNTVIESFKEIDRTGNAKAVEVSTGGTIRWSDTAFAMFMMWE